MTTTRYERFAIACFALAIPLFPSFITLEALTPAGLNVVPRPAVFVLLALFGLLAVTNLRALRLRSPLGPRIAVMLGAWTLSAITGFDPVGSLIMIALLGATSMVHLGVVTAFAEGSGERCFLVPFFISGIVATAAALAMAFTHAPAALYALGHGRAIGTFLHPGELAGYALVLTPVALGAAGFARMPSTRVLGAVAGLLGLAALAASYSRAAWGAGAVAAVFAAFTVVRGRGRPVVAAVLLAAAVAFAFVGERHHNPDEDFTRLAAWRAGIRAVEASPLLGSGPATFWRLYPALRPPDGYPDLVHAHDVLLAVATESGLVGLAAFVALWLRFVALLRGGLDRCDERARGMMLAIGTAMVATWVQGTIDLVTVVMVALWLPFMGMALGLSREAAP